MIVDRKHLKRSIQDIMCLELVVSFLVFFRYNKVKYVSGKYWAIDYCMV